MPQIVDQAEVLNGRGRVIQYGNGDSPGKWFYKERIEGTRTYRTKIIKGAVTLEEAKEMATEIAFQMTANADLKRNQRDPMDLVLREERLQARIEKLNRDEKEKTKSIAVEASIEDISSDMDSYEDVILENGIPKYFSKKMKKYVPIKKKNIDSVFLTVKNTLGKIDYIMIADAI